MANTCYKLDNLVRIQITKKEMDQMLESHPGHEHEGDERRMLSPGNEH